MKNNIFKIQFFDGRKAIWKDIPTLKTIIGLDEAKAYKKSQEKLTEGHVTFRIVQDLA